jgi:hypothetical protein
MFGNDPWAKLKQGFADQFEPYGDGQFVYRKNLNGPAIPVTAEERERFIDDYARRLRHANWIFMAALILFVGVLIWWTVQSNRDVPQVVLYGGMIGLMAVSVSYSIWARGAPARELEGRTPVAAERSTEQMREMMFHKMTYAQLAGAAAFGPLVPVMMAFGRHPIDVFHGWGRLWLVLGAALTLFAAVQAFRKWRFEIDHPSGMI